MAGRSELYFNNVGITIIPTTLYCMYYTYVRIVCWFQLDNVPSIIRLCLQHCNPFQQPRFFILQYYIVKVTTRVTTLWTWRARPNSYPCSGGRTRDWLFRVCKVCSTVTAQSQDPNQGHLVEAACSSLLLVIYSHFPSTVVAWSPCMLIRTAPCYIGTDVRWEGPQSPASMHNSTTLVTCNLITPVSSCTLVCCRSRARSWKYHRIGLSLQYSSAAELLQWLYLNINITEESYHHASGLCFKKEGGVPPPVLSKQQLISIPLSMITR